MGQLDECANAHNGRAAAGEPPPSPPAPADPSPAPTPLAHRQRQQQRWRRGGACSAGRPCYPLGLTRLPPELLSATTACGDGGSGGGSGREKLCEGMASGAGTDAEGGSGAHRPPAAGPPWASNHLESDVGFGSSVGGSGGVFDRLPGGDLARCRAVHSSWRDWLDQGEEHEEGAAAEGLKQAVAADDEEEEEAAGTDRRTGGSSKPRHWQASVRGGRRLLWQRAAVADGLYDDVELNPAPEPKGQPQPAYRSNMASIGCNAPAGWVMGAAGSIVGGASDGLPGQQGPRGGCNGSSSSNAGSSSSAGGDGGHAAAGRAVGHQLYTACLANKVAQRLAWLTLISKDLPHVTEIVTAACLPAEELCGWGIGSSGGGGGGGGGDEGVGGPSGPPPRHSRTLACLERVVSRLALLLESGRVQLEVVGEGGNAGQWQAEGPRELDAGGDGGHTAAQMSSLCHSISSYREFALQGVGACGLTLREVAHTRGVALCGSAGCEQLAACEAHSKAASAHAARRVHTLRMALESLDLKAAAIAVGGNGDGDGGTAAAAHVAGILRRGLESGVRPALHATYEAIIGAATAIQDEMMAMLELSMKL